MKTIIIVFKRIKLNNPTFGVELYFNYNRSLKSVDYLTFWIDISYKRFWFKLEWK